MPLAKDLKPATFGFLLGPPGPLAREDAVLALVTAVTADGGFRAAKEVMLFALNDGHSPALIREAILHAAPFAGLVRVETGLAALGHAGEEREKPANPLDLVLGAVPKRTGESKALDPDDEKPLAAVVPPFEPRGARRSKTLARWFKDQLFGQVFGRGLTVERRLLLSIAAIFPLDARLALEEVVTAAKAKGAAPAALWALHDLLSNLFRDGPEVKAALRAFENVLGRRHGDELGPGADPFRWD
jgi:alkylhydroperoxidase/carboxymuconolactone decarboxylase family protein YurZ